MVEIRFTSLTSYQQKTLLDIFHLHRVAIAQSVISVSFSFPSTLIEPQSSTKPQKTPTAPATRPPSAQPQKPPVQVALPTSGRQATTPRGGSQRQVPRQTATPVMAFSEGGTGEFEAGEFQIFMEKFGNFRHVQTWKGSGTTLQRLIGTIDGFIDDRRTTVQLQRVTTTGIKEDVGDMMCKHMCNNFRLRSSLEHAVLDFVGGLLRFRHSCMQVDVFARLLIGEFDGTDLLFYKYVRSVTKGSKAQMTLSHCVDFSRRIFGQEQKHMHGVLVQTLEAEISAVGAVTDPAVLIDTQFFVYLLVWVFHHQRTNLDSNHDAIRDSQGLARSIGNFKPDLDLEDNDDDVDRVINSIHQYRQAASELVSRSGNRSRVSESEASSPGRQQFLKVQPQGGQEDPIEKLINDALLEACRKFVKDQTHAKLLVRECDALMRKVAENDFDGWKTTGAPSTDFHHLSGLLGDLQSIDSADSETFKQALAIFCEALAHTTVALIHQQ
jgi:hypothetical protein